MMQHFDWLRSLGLWRVSFGLLLLAPGLTGGGSARAARPEPPDSLLEGGDAVLLAAPVADFKSEIERLVGKPFPATSTQRDDAERVALEAAELGAALGKLGWPSDDATNLVRRFCQDRARLLKIRPSEAAGGDPEPSVEGEPAPVVAPGALVPGLPSGTPPPTAPGAVRVTPGLPGEFADYLRGALAWRQGDNPAAIAAWKALLERPASERHYRSTWAAYMLGKTLLEDEPETAARYFQQVRDFVRRGLADSLNLADSILGWEAEIHCLGGRYPKALELYLDQAATGDETAVIGLRETVLAALRAGGRTLTDLAAHPLSRRVVTAYLISCREHDEARRPGATKAEPPAVQWLSVLETAGTTDADLAESLALCACQNGRLELAERWLARAKLTPVTQWLRAKLLLRAGRLEPATVLLAKIAPLFARDAAADPIPPADEPARAASTSGTRSGSATLPRSRSPSLAESLHAPWSRTRLGSAEQVLGELGSLQLARRDYPQALDSFLRADLWPDAAYVAERVLTLDELRQYVDNHWPPPAKSETDHGDRVQNSTSAQVAPEDTLLASETARARVGERVRYLLARRLSRGNPSREARPYYPEPWQPAFASLLTSMTVGEDPHRPAAERAAAWWKAACLVRTNGLELLGTELEPDWALHGGNFTDGITTDRRSALAELNLVAASPDELRRGQEHAPNPERRFHYRYLAASLAMDAARLMPDNSDDTARVLCLAGTWLKSHDPKMADLFYKALVRRCRQTALGAEADRRRWFPTLDADGNLVVP